jgi:4-nitrophenyl phosphatase
MNPVRGVIMDLDGTTYAGNTEIPGARTFISKLRSYGIKVMFATNRANRTPKEIAEQLVDMHIPCSPSDVLTTAEATAWYLANKNDKKKKTAFCIGEQGLLSALKTVNIIITDNKPDYVIVSIDRDFNYEKLTKACCLINNGAKFIATNPDVKLKVDSGFVPGTGAIVAAVRAATGVKPLVIGKPGKLLFEMTIHQLKMRPDEVIAIGDNISTDIPAGIKAGIRTALLLCGVSSMKDIKRSRYKPTWIASNFDELWKILSPCIRKQK